MKTVFVEKGKKIFSCWSFFFNLHTSVCCLLLNIYVQSVHHMYHFLTNVLNINCWFRNFKPLTKTSHCFSDETASTPQFTVFAALVAWLLAECSVHDFIPWTEYDNPATVSTTIAQQVKSMGTHIYIFTFLPFSVSSYPPHEHSTPSFR